MADPEVKRKAARGDCLTEARGRVIGIMLIRLDDGERARLTEVLSQVWDDGYGYGRDAEAAAGPTEASDEDRIRDAMAEAQEHPGRVVTR